MTENVNPEAQARRLLLAAALREVMYPSHPDGANFIGLAEDEIEAILRDVHPLVEEMVRNAGDEGWNRGYKVGILMAEALRP